MELPAVGQAVLDFNPVADRLRLLGCRMAPTSALIVDHGEVGKKMSEVA